MVMFLLIGSTAFALVFRGLYGDIWIEDLLTGLPGGKIGLLLVANLTIFILGFFLDFFEIAFIIIPLLAPAAALLGIDLVWFGVMIGMNLQTSFLTPPVRLRPLLPEGCGTAGGEDHRPLPCGDPVHHHPADRAAADHPVAGAGDGAGAVTLPHRVLQAPLRIEPQQKVLGPAGIAHPVARSRCSPR